MPLNDSTTTAAAPTATTTTAAPTPTPTPQSPCRVLLVFGTRPEAVKMAPLVQVLSNDPAFDCRVAVTAQHREMLGQVLRLFAIKPHYDLDIMRPQQSLEDITVKILQGISGILAKEAPRVVLVHGDTSTAFATTLAAFYRQIDVGHVEAGLRTGKHYDPFPEEMNRRLVDAMATWHFAPTATNRENLLAENIKASGIFVTGNTVIEALRSAVNPQHIFHDAQLNAVVRSPGRMLLVTTHRRENIAAGRMPGLYRALRRILELFPDTRVVFAVHKNPAVRSIVEAELSGLERLHLIEPPDYADFINLEARAHLILTDSGGLQEEGPALGKPVLVLRETTERPEGVAAGVLRLVGTATENVVAAAAELLSDEAAYNRMARAINPYGDGLAAIRIRDALKYAYMNGERPADFSIVGEALTTVAH